MAKDVTLISREANRGISAIATDDGPAIPASPLLEVLGLDYLGCAV